MARTYQMVYTQGRSKRVHTGQKVFCSPDSAKKWAKEHDVRTFALISRPKK